jgi:hypothetical protein
LDSTNSLLKTTNLLVVAMNMALLACSQSDGPAADHTKLIGNYTLVVDANQPVTRKDFESSVLNLSPDGTFLQECRYLEQKIESINGTWSYSERHVQFSVFRDCAGVWPPSPLGREGGANLIVEITSPLTILLSPDINVRYERRA